MSYEYESAANLPNEEKELWYNNEKTCPSLPDNLYDNVDWIDQASYFIEDNASWPVYKRAISQAETWTENDQIKRIVVRVSMTYFILTETDYKSLTSKKRH